MHRFPSLVLENPAQFSVFPSTNCNYNCSPYRLVELAPQYYLENLPPSEGRDLLMEIRQCVFPPEEQENEDGEDEAHGQQSGEHRDQYSTEMCVLQ